MKVCRLKVLLPLSVDFLGFIGSVVCLVFLVSSRIYREVTDYGLSMGLLVSGGVIILCLLWFALLFLIAPALKFEIIVMFRHFSIGTENNDIIISQNNFEYRIPKNRLRYILDYAKGVMLIWDAEEGIKTFFVRKFFFDKKEYHNFVNELAMFDGYSNDSDKKEKIRKENGLNHIFRKNKLELQM